MFLSEGKSGQKKYLLSINSKGFRLKEFDMNDLFKNKLFWVAMILGGTFFAVGVGKKAIVNVIADRVIEKLQKDYSPSPYGPGIDPDKLDVQGMSRPKKVSVWDE